MEEKDYIPLSKNKKLQNGEAAKQKNADSRVNRKARLIVRNLPYKVKDSQLKAIFEKHGEVLEVCTLKRSDGKLVGCAFIQFRNVKEASAAVEKVNGQECLGRKLQVKFAISKHDYDKKTEVKQEKVEVKAEVKEEKPKKEGKKGPRNFGSDDGLTIFIKNLNFDTTDQELGESMSQFGPFDYALVTKEAVSGHSKGTGFVRFKTQASADLCLQNSGKIVLRDFTLEMLPAISRTEASSLKAKEKPEEKKDSRNLFLLKEGVIMSGSSAAEGVSAQDMQKRLFLERSKTEMLKNLNRFVARDRLTIHNLPDSLIDGKLRKIVTKFTNISPKECRIMRENRPSPEALGGKSKGFGFLSFQTHEEALKVLRKLNNNPSVFGKNSRPIVSFSIEDKKALNIKQKRLEKSKLQNPTYQAKMDKKKKEVTVGKYVLLKQRSTEVPTVPTEDFSGVEAKQGVIRPRSKSKLEMQANTHLKNVTKQRKEAKQKKVKAEIRKEKAQMRVRKTKKTVQDKDKFVEMFNDYKKLFAAGSTEKQSKKKKWYSET